MPQGNATSLVPYHNIDPRDPKHLDIPQNTILVHYMDDIMLTGPGKQEIVITLNAFVINTRTHRHIHKHINIIYCVVN